MEAKIDFDEKSTLFLQYFKNKNAANELIEFLKNSFSVYLFSGVIRDFFLEYPSKFRDIDLVVIGEEDLETVLNEYKNITFARNSFGGFKVHINNISVDIWEYSKSWAIRKGKITDDLFFSIYSLLKSPFFNFSAIVYDFQVEKFYPTEDFISFLKKKEIDLVFEENPSPELCVINTIYYKNKYNLSISRRLMRFCIKAFKKYDSLSFENTQIKHFGMVLYDYTYIKIYIDIFKEKVNR